MLYKNNQIINVEISKIKPYGAFVKVDDEYTGLIHISQINGKFIKDIHSILHEGEIRKVKILSIDEDKKQMKLSMVIDNMYKKTGKLPETSLGFELFDEILPNWIKTKLDEIKSDEENR